MSKRDPELIKKIRNLNCFICSHPPPSDAAHITTRRLCGDEPNNLLPLCRAHHQEQHRIGIITFKKKYHLPIDDSLIRPKLTFEWKL